MSSHDFSQVINVFYRQIQLDFRIYINCQSLDNHRFEAATVWNGIHAGVQRAQHSLAYKV